MVNFVVVLEYRTGILAVNSKALTTESAAKEWVEARADGLEKALLILSDEFGNYMRNIYSNGSWLMP